MLHYIFTLLILTTALSVSANTDSINYQFFKENGVIGVYVKFKGAKEGKTYITIPFYNDGIADEFVFEAKSKSGKVLKFDYVREKNEILGVDIKHSPNEELVLKFVSFPEILRTPFATETGAYFSGDILIRPILKNHDNITFDFSKIGTKYGKIIDKETGKIEDLSNNIKNNLSALFSPHYVLSKSPIRIYHQKNSVKNKIMMVGFDLDNANLG